jgi:hypothetical protein
MIKASLENTIGDPSSDWSLPGGPADSIDEASAEFRREAEARHNAA